jgi:hypothetical protein
VAEVMGIMDKMMKKMMGRMSGENKEGMMDKLMNEFFAEMSPQDKQKMMVQMMPRMMGGVNMMGMMPQMMMGMMAGGQGEDGMMEIMSKMMGDEPEPEKSQMPQMMTSMIPRYLEMMLPSMDKEKRIDFVLEMVTTLKEQSGADMSEEEKADLVARIIERARK